MPEMNNDLCNYTCNTPPVVLNFITIHANFVAANDGFEIILLAELPGDIRTELHTNTTLTRSTTRLFLGVCPKHFHHEPSLTRLSLGVPVQLPNVIQGNIVVRKQTAV